MGDDHQNRLLAAVQVEQQRCHVLGCGAIQIAGWLVTKHEPRLPDERPRDRHPLPLAARQLTRSMIDSIGEAHLRDEVAGSLGGLVSTSLRRELGCGSDQRRDQNIFENRTLRQQAVVLEDEPDRGIAERGQFVGPELKRVAPVERHGTGGRGLERAQEIQQRALAAAGWSHDGRRLAGRERERHVAQHGQRSARCRVLFAEIRDS